MTQVRYEPTDPRLGRHVAHDERSRSFPLTGAFIPSKPIDWHRDDADVFDQGDLGCCTAAAALGLLVTAPYKRPGRIFNIADIHGVYRDATAIDPFPGTWPPDDTGSNGLAAMKVLRKRGWTTGYRWAFSPAVALAALAHGPIAVGTVWLDSMFTVRRGLVVIDRKSPVAGGHEWVADGWDPRFRRVRMTNSWGTGWGDGGRAWLRYTDFAWLLNQQGDVVQPILAP